MSESHANHVSALKLTFEEVRRERDRLRDARGWAARQLGPLPAAAGISTGIVVAFSGHTRQTFLWLALGFLVLMVAVSIAYSRMQPYRQMRAEREGAWRSTLNAAYPQLAKEAAARGLMVEDLLREPEWYAAMIKFERDLYGPLDRTTNRYRPPRRQPENLQDAFDRERTGLFAAQILFVVVIACLVLSRLV